MNSDAWKDIRSSDDERVWNFVNRELKFSPSVAQENWPSFREPTPSMTFDISHAFDSEDNYQTLVEEDLNLKALRIFRSLVKEEQYIFALDWQHPCYMFYPHQKMTLDEADWGIPVLPNGDYYIFLDVNFRWGWLGHPWEKTICIFGEDALSALEQSRPKLFSRPVRQQDT